MISLIFIYKYTDISILDKEFTLSFYDKTQMKIYTPTQRFKNKIGIF